MGRAEYGILLVAYGTRVRAARQAYVSFEARVRARWPGMPVAWGFSSAALRRQLAAQGDPQPSIAEGLASLAAQGVTRVAVQSLHLLAGSEYDSLRQQARQEQGGALGFTEIQVGLPLLASAQDLSQVLSALLATVPPERLPREPILLMGHGSKHPADLAYLAAAELLRGLDPRAFIATLEGYPQFTDLLARLVEHPRGRIWLLPLVAVAGGHVRRDLAGDEPESWASQLRAADFTPVVMAQGCLEVPAIAELWLAHLAAILPAEPSPQG